MHVTTVFVTHDQEEAMDVADEIVILNHGHIEQIGAPRAVRAPRNEFVMGFLGPVNEWRMPLVRPTTSRSPTAPIEARLEALVERIGTYGFEVRVEIVRPTAGSSGRRLTREVASRWETGDRCTCARAPRGPSTNDAPRRARCRKSPGWDSSGSTMEVNDGERAACSPGSSALDGTTALWLGRGMVVVGEAGEELGAAIGSSSVVLLGPGYHEALNT